MLTEVDGCAVSCRERKKVEMLFAHLKRILRFGRLRLRGPNGAKDEFLLAATAENLRKLAKLIPLPAPNQYCASSIASSGLHHSGYTRCMEAACVVRHSRDTCRHLEATPSPSMVGYLADSFPSERENVDRRDPGKAVC
jgi:Transposase DDE domain